METIRHRTSTAGWLTNALGTHRAALELNQRAEKQIRSTGIQIVGAARTAGMSWDQIGAVLGVSGNTARMRWNRGAI